MVSNSGNKSGWAVVPRSGRVDGGVDHARAALALGEPRAAPVRSGWAEATQRGRGNGGKVVRKRGRGMKYVG